MKPTIFTPNAWASTLPKLSLVVCTSVAGHTMAAAQTDTLVITADYFESNALTIPESTTLIGNDDISARNAEHLEQVLSYAPNVNFAAGSSRGRYFQIRGIGERSQFIDPVNPSVGLVIDGIDMTGLGGAATLFDVQQVEILRGPQGTRFGANALAGMINIISQGPTDEFEGYAKAKLGNYNAWGTGGAISGPITERLSGRLAIHQFQSDGYMDNVFLNREDTNNIDELLARGKLAYQLGANTQLGLTYLFADIDNGYDAFSLDNTRQTYSDEPGQDTQETHALALTLDTKLSAGINLHALLSGSQSDVIYSYDEDWSYVGIAPAFEYSSTDEYRRDYDRYALDVRLQSSDHGRILNQTTAWVLGVYSQSRDEDLARDYTYNPGPYSSALNSESTALYGEINSQINDSLRLIVGLRMENWRNEFEDSNAIIGDTDEYLKGGKITLEQLLTDQHLSYVSLARGYKPGGINTDPDVAEANRIFDTEYNNALELGLKSNWSTNFSTAISLFYIERKDQQVKSSYAEQDPNTNAINWIEFLTNAAEGRNQGIELESRWAITDKLNWRLSLGLLDTEFTDYSFQTDDGEVNVTGRDQGHAPNYSAATSIRYDFTNQWSVLVEVEAKDEFYFSDSHDLQSEAYELFHAKLSYDTEHYSLALFGRNLTDEDYGTRGFGFENDPRDQYTSFGYTQLGEPRLIGLEAQYNF